MSEEQNEEEKPATVPEAKQAGEMHDRWKWVEPTVWTERMLSALEEGSQRRQLVQPDRQSLWLQN